MSLRLDDERRLRATRRPVPADDFVLTFQEWRALNKLSERGGRRVLAGPDGPTVTQLSARRIGITVGNNRAWQKSRERA
jgi:hypothetical protein